MHPLLLHPRNSFGGVFKYLTFWNLIVQLVFFILCLLSDFREELSQVGQRACSFFFLVLTVEASWSSW